MSVGQLKLFSGTKFIGLVLLSGTFSFLMMAATSSVREMISEKLPLLSLSGLKVSLLKSVFLIVFGFKLVLSVHCFSVNLLFAPVHLLDCRDE